MCLSVCQHRKHLPHLLHYRGSHCSIMSLRNLRNFNLTDLSFAYAVFLFFNVGIHRGKCVFQSSVFIHFRIGC